ncbi:MAG: substrate-binding domain-containing protein [Pseudodesulfovibrio sp.]
MIVSGESVAASLVVYGPGGPYPAIRRCADLFGAGRGVVVDVRFGEPAKQADQAAKDGDVYYTGAEYMMDDFIRDYPALLDASAVIYPAARRVGIIVRRGNPKEVESLADLAAPGLRILDVRLENMAGIRGGANANVAVSVTTGREGFAAWKADSTLDAWVTYRTWAAQLGPGEGAFIPIDGPEGVRRIPVTVMRNAPHPGLARAFLEFLETDEARAVFLENGYEPY